MARRTVTKPLTLAELQDRLKATEEAVVKLQGTVQALKTPQPLKVEPMESPALKWLGPGVGLCCRSFVMFHVGATTTLPTLPNDDVDVNNLDCLFKADATAAGTMLRGTQPAMEDHCCYVAAHRCNARPQ
jgi:hypothetical protein